MMKMFAVLMALASRVFDILCDVAAFIKKVTCTAMVLPCISMMHVEAPTTEPKKSRFQVWLEGFLTANEVEAVKKAKLNFASVADYWTAFGQRPLGEKLGNEILAAKILAEYEKYRGIAVEKRHLPTFKAHAFDIADAKIGSIRLGDIINGEMNSVEALRAIECICDNLAAASCKIKFANTDAVVQNYGCSEGSEMVGIKPGELTDLITYIDSDIRIAVSEWVEGGPSRTKIKNAASNMMRMMAHATVHVDGERRTFGFGSTSHVKHMAGGFFPAKWWEENRNIFFGGLSAEEINKRGGLTAAKENQIVAIYWTPSIDSGIRIEDIIFVPEEKSIRSFEAKGHIVEPVMAENTTGLRHSIDQTTVRISLFDGQGVWIYDSAQVRGGLKGEAAKTPIHSSQYGWVGKKVPNMWGEEEIFDETKVGIFTSSMLKDTVLYKSRAEFIERRKKYGKGTIRIVRAENLAPMDSKELSRQIWMSLFDMTDDELTIIAREAIMRYEQEVAKDGSGYREWLTGKGIKYVAGKNGITVHKRYTKNTASAMLFRRVPALGLDLPIYEDWEKKVDKERDAILGNRVGRAGCGFMAMVRDTFAFMQIYVDGMDANDPDLGKLGHKTEKCPGFGDEEWIVDVVNMPGKGGQRVTLNRFPAPYFSWVAAVTVDLPFYDNNCITIGVNTIMSEIHQSDEDGDELFFLFMDLVWNKVLRMQKDHNILPVFFKKITEKGKDNKKYGIDETKVIPTSEKKRNERLAEFRFNSWSFNLVGEYTNWAIKAWNSITLDTDEDTVQEAMKYCAKCYALITWAVDAMKTGKMVLMPDNMTDEEDVPWMRFNKPYNDRFCKATKEHPSYKLDIDEDGEFVLRPSEYWDSITEDLGESVIDRLTKICINIGISNEVDIYAACGVRRPNEDEDDDAYRMHVVADTIASLIPNYEHVRNSLKRPLTAEQIELLKQFGRSDFTWVQEVDPTSFDQIDAIEEMTNAILEKNPELDGKIGRIGMNAHGMIEYKRIRINCYRIYQDAIAGNDISAYNLLRLCVSQTTDWLKRTMKSDETTSKRFSNMEIRDAAFMQLLEGYKSESSVDDFTAMLSVVRSIFAQFARNLKNWANGEGHEETLDRQMRKFAYRVFTRYLCYLCDANSDGVYAFKRKLNKYDPTSDNLECDEEMSVEETVGEVDEALSFMDL